MKENPTKSTMTVSSALEILDTVDPEKLSHKELSEIIETLTQGFQRAAERTLLQKTVRNPEDGTVALINFTNATGALRSFHIARYEDAVDDQGNPSIERKKYFIYDEKGDYVESQTGYLTAEDALEDAKATLTARGYRIVEE